MQTQVVLTVSEGKRLIAKGIAEYQPVIEALHKGWVAVAKGSTNAYVVEELGGKIVVPKMAVKGMGWFAIALDPDGNVFGLWEMDQSSA